MLIEQTEDSDYTKVDKVDAIELKNISVDIGGFCLKDFNMKFSKEHINYLCGPSGCGKTLVSTLFYSNKHKYSGVILINNTKSEGLNFNNVSICLQNAMVLDRSVYENLNYPKLNQTINPELLKVLNIDLETLTSSVNKANGFNAKNLSGGEKRKISLYRTLNKKSDVYILDEPTNDLDESTIKNLKQFLEKQKGKAIYIIITHNSNFIIDNSNIINLNNASITA